MNYPTLTFTISIVLILIYCLGSSFAADAQEAGFVELTVVHLDGDSLDPAEFLSEENFQLGHYSVFDDDGDFMVDAGSCNMGSACELALGVGIYEAGVVDSNSLTPYSSAFEVTANSTTQVTIQVDQGSFQISVLDNVDDSLSSVSDFGHPGAFLETGWFAMYETSGDFILDGITCNYDDNCSYSYDSGTYIVAIRNALDNQVISCRFDVTDNDVNQVEFYLESDDCNQTVTELPKVTDKNNSGSGSNNNNDNSGNSGSNTNTGSDQSSSGSNNNSNSNSANGNTGQNSNTNTANPLEVRSVSILGSSSYIDNSGHFHLIGEVRNTQSIPAQDVVVTAVFFGNETNEVLAIKRAQTFVEYLKPGDKSPFEIIVKDTGVSNSIANHVLSASFSNMTKIVKPSVLGVEVTNHYYSNETGLYNVEGRVFNYADSNARFVRVTISVYDNNTSILYAGQKYVTSVLPSGTLSEFKLSFSPKNASQITTLSAHVESDEFLVIGNTNKLRDTPITLTLDSTYYENGDTIVVNGTIGTPVNQGKYASIYILWPNKINHDREFLRLGEDGSYRMNIAFYTSPEFKGETFVVRVFYNNNFAERTFVFDSNSQINY